MNYSQRTPNCKILITRLHYLRFLIIKPYFLHSFITKPYFYTFFVSSKYNLVQYTLSSIRFLGNSLMKYFLFSQYIIKGTWTLD